MRKGPLNILGTYLNNDAFRGVRHPDPVEEKRSPDGADEIDESMTEA